MGVVETMRDALFGNPPVPNMQPSREGMLAAITELNQRVVGISTGLKPYELVTDLPASTSTAPLGSQGRVWGDPDPENNTFWIRTAASGPNNGWVIDQDYIDQMTAVVDPLVAEAEAAAAEAAASASFATQPRSKLIKAGIPQEQDVTTPTNTGFLMTSITTPASRRTITRGADKITLAASTGITAGIIYEQPDQKGGRQYTAEFVVTAGAGNRGVGIGFTSPARAATARADATQTTFVEVDALATNDTQLFVLRQSGTAQCIYQSAAGLPAVDTTNIAFSSFAAFPVTWTNNDRIRVVAWVPDDNTTQRRLDFYNKVSGGSAFVWIGYILVNAAVWPAGNEVWAGGYSLAAWTVEIDKASMTVDVREPEFPALRCMQAAPAIVGLGARTEPVSDLRQLFNSVDESSDNLHATIGSNGGAPYRVVNSGGFVFPWARFREITLIGDAGLMPEIRGSILPIAPWTSVSGNVWKTTNRFNNVASSTNGGVVCYDTSAIPGFHLPGCSRRMFGNAGLNASAVTLNALTQPHYSAQADGDMWIVLPGGEDPNSLSLELVQCGTLLQFGGPSAPSQLWRPRVTMKDLALTGATINVLDLRVWDILLDHIKLEGAGVEPLLQQECSGFTYGIQLSGSNGDNHKCNPYTGAGGSEFYTDANRPTTTHYDMRCHAAGVAGNAAVADNTSLHAKGGPQIFHGGRFWDATKHNHSHIDSFEARGVDCRRGGQGGIMVAFDAARDGDFAIEGGSIQDAGVAGIIVDRQAGAGTTRGIVCGTKIGRPTVATPVGILVSNSGGTASQINFDDVDTRIDSTIATPRQGYSSATVRQQVYA